MFLGAVIPDDHWVHVVLLRCFAIIGIIQNMNMLSYNIGKSNTYTHTDALREIIPSQTLCVGGLGTCIIERLRIQFVLDCFSICPVEAMISGHYT